MLFSEAIGQFVDYLENQERSGTTIKGYQLELNSFRRYLEEKANRPVYLSEVDVDELESYLAHLRKKGLQPNSRSRVQRIFGSFAKFCYRKKLTENNLAHGIEPIKVPVKSKEFLNREEVQRIIENIQHPTVQVLTLCLAKTGMRISEATSLQLEDLNFSEGTIRIRKGKGAKGRVVPLSSTLKVAIRFYIEHLRIEKGSNRVFVSRKSSGLSSKYVNMEIRKAAQRAGVKKKATAHSFRHFFASELARNNDVSLVTLQEILGHSSLAVTSIYTHSTPDEMKEAAELI